MAVSYWIKILENYMHILVALQKAKFCISNDSLFFLHWIEWTSSYSFQFIPVFNPLTRIPQKDVGMYWNWPGNNCMLCGRLSFWRKGGSHSQQRRKPDHPIIRRILRETTIDWGWSENPGNIVCTSLISYTPTIKVRDPVDYHLRRAGGPLRCKLVGWCIPAFAYSYDRKDDKTNAYVTVPWVQTGWHMW